MSQSGEKLKKPIILSFYEDYSELKRLNFFPLILPKKHSLITQKQFWPFFGVFSGFLVLPQNYIICLFKSVFWQFLCEKNGRKSRDPASRLVNLLSKSHSTNHCNAFLLVRRRIRKNLEFSPCPFVRSQRLFSKSVHYFFLKFGS